MMPDGSPVGELPLDQGLFGPQRAELGRVARERFGLLRERVRHHGRRVSRARDTLDRPQARCGAVGSAVSTSSTSAVARARLAPASSAISSARSNARAPRRQVPARLDPQARNSPQGSSRPATPLAGRNRNRRCTRSSRSSSHALAGAAARARAYEAGSASASSERTSSAISAARADQRAPAPGRLRSPTRVPTRPSRSSAEVADRLELPRDRLQRAPGVLRDRSPATVCSDC